jgi:hypothetical protein
VTQSLLGRYLQYSKRIALFGIIQWSVLALVSLTIVLLSHVFSVVVDEFVVRIVNNIIACSSALAIAICSGYYAHSAYDNSLKQKVASAINGDLTASDTNTGNG